MLGMRMMRTRQVWERRPVFAVRRRVKRTVRTWLIGVMMDAGHKFVAVCVVMILAFKMCQVVLRFFCDRADPGNYSAFLFVRMTKTHKSKVNGR